MKTALHWDDLCFLAKDRDFTEGFTLVDEHSVFVEISVETNIRRVFVEQSRNN